MKIITKMSAVLCLTFSLQMAMANPLSSPIKPKISSAQSQQQLLVNALEQRLQVIHEIDPNTLSRAQKKEMRNEVKSIQKELAHQGGGVYISVGGLILIIILLIILF